MGLGLLFPGQGAQHAAMLPWLDRVDPVPGALAGLRVRFGDGWRDRMADTAWASQNRVAQLLVTGASLAAWESIASLLPAPAAVAGLSVGEIAATCVAGVFDVAAALDLAERRAAIMDDAARGQHTGLLALSGATQDWVDGLCASHGLAVAIRLGAAQATVGGLQQDLDRAREQALAAGVACTPMPVALASHTTWLQSAVEPLAAVLARMDMQAPRVVWVSNRSGQAVRRTDALRQALASQVAHVVQWDSCMDTLAERGVRCVLELGPGHALARAWQVRHPAIPARSLEDFQQPAAAAHWVRATLARA